VKEVNLLLIEDTDAGFDRFRRLFQGCGFQVSVFRVGSTDLDNIRENVTGILEKRDIQLVVTNLCLSVSPRDGLKMIKFIKKMRPTVPVVVWTKHSYEGWREKANKLGVNLFLEKFVGDHDLAKQSLALLPI
jgi:CheY-like chemotaxis protein